MDIKEAIKSGLKELILPELKSIKSENKEIKTKLDMTNKRLDDINLHLVDHSRKIDETNKRIDETKNFLLTQIIETNKRIDETNRRLNSLYEVIVRREEHEKIELRVIKLEKDIALLKEKMAA